MKKPPASLLYPVVTEVEQQFLGGV
jgi:hypothetical protein